ncbi:hypothetical protein TRFO_09605 [Tritrichomonas foetus]|uniref:BEACH domain-containing protein n=1 Tax=Tritrichomonas foetus TaxID=1144522 RepID=A0A1J4JFK9_9EUKA|nr:hypothetical protein TRFO_09605 [Tritrichomonas foetus]|eukprot:OHS97071.1 hypothetical protein TRFO_09605 [Tritrichomonas foetus]
MNHNDMTKYYHNIKDQLSSEIDRCKITMSETERVFEFLFKFRNEQEPLINNEPQSFVVDYFREIPIIDNNRVTQFLKEVRSTKDVKSSLVNIGYDYVYESIILQSFLENDSIIQYAQNERFIVIITFQLISCIYFRSKITENDFRLFIQIFNMLINSKLTFLIQFCFKQLMISVLEQDAQIWSKDNIAFVFSHFSQNRKLPASFYSVFTSFIFNIIDTEKDDQSYLENAVSLIHTFLIQKREILHVKDFHMIFDIIRPLLAKMNKSALFSLAELSKIIPDSGFKQELITLPSMFATNAKQLMNFRIEKSQKIHELSEKCSNFTSSFIFEFLDKDTFINDRFYPVPNELGVEPFLLFKQLNKDLENLAFLYKSFVEMLKPELINLFFDEMIRALSHFHTNDGYSVFAVFLFFVNILEKYPNICEVYIPYLFDDFLFHPKYTVFGPFSLDPTINLFRSTIIDMIAAHSPKLFYDLLNSFKEYPFLFTEILGRLLFKVPIKKLMSDTAFKMISDVYDNLQYINAPSYARSTIISFILQYLKNPSTFYECLNSRFFIDSFFKMMFEKGVTKIFLNVLQESLCMINDKETINKLTIMKEYLLMAASRCPEIKQQILFFVSGISSIKPYYISLFHDFLGLFLSDLKIKHTASLPQLQKSINYTISFLSDVSSYEGEKFSLSPEYFSILADNIDLISFENLINLISESKIIKTTSQFLMKRPDFLLLLFIKYNNKSEEIVKILTILLKLAQYSEYNCRALHDGKVDLILLNLLDNQMPVTINRRSINFNVDDKTKKKIVIPLIKLICKSKSNNEIAKFFTNSITERKSFELLKLLDELLSSLSVEPSSQYQVGNNSSFCEITGLSTSVLNGDFTISFFLKTDPGSLLNNTTIINLITFHDKSHHRFSISLINGVLFASLTSDSLHTMVSLSPRMNFNKWTFYTIEFSKHEQGFRILTFKDFERLHDSDFCPLNFDNGQMKITLGGYKYHGKLNISNQTLHCGYISSIRMYNRVITLDELHLNGVFSDKAPSDYFFSSYDFPPNFSKTNFSFENNKVHMNATFSRNNHDIEKLNDLICHYDKYFINSILQMPLNLLNRIVSILRYLVSSSSSKKLSADLAGVFNNISDKISYQTFITLTNIVNTIKNAYIRDLWLEDIVFNLNIWVKCKDFPLILRYLRDYVDYYSRFLSMKNYFSYFLPNYNKYLNDKSVIDDFSMFMARTSYVNLSTKDCDLLFSYISNSNNKITYLNLVLNMTKPILKIKYPADQKLYSFLQSDKMDIVINTIIVLHSLCINDFHARIIAILQLISLDRKDLLTELEKHVENNPNIFSLTCSLALTLGSPVTVIPRSVSTSDLWFVFPILLTLKSEEELRTKILDFISLNAVSCNQLEMIINFVILLDVASNHAPDFDIVQQLLTYMINASREYNINVRFIVFFNTVSTIFFHLNGKLFHEEISLDNPVEKLEKITFSSLDSVFSFFSRDFSSLKFNFHLAVKGNELFDVMLLINALSLTDSLIDIELSDVKTTRTGIFSNAPQFTMQDLQETLSHFKSSQRSSRITIDQFSKISLIFEWMKDRLTEKFISEISSLSKQVHMMFEMPSVPQEDLDFMIKFEHDENNRLNNLLQSITCQTCIVRDQSLNLFYYPHLMKRAKNGRKLLSVIRYEAPIIENDKTNDISACSTCFNKNIPISINLNTDGIIIDSKLIPFSSIKRIMYVNDTSILLISRSKTYLINFGKKHDFFFDSLKNVLNSSPGPNPQFFIASTKEAIINTFWDLHNLWKQNSVSTFDYLNILNLLSGRTYLCSSKYPLFPSIELLKGEKVDESTLPPLDKTLFDGCENAGNQQAKTNEKIAYSAPEIYFLFESFTHSNENPLKVYENRKLLESSSKVVEKFIIKNFSSIVDETIARQEPVHRIVNPQELKIKINEKSKPFFVSTMRLQRAQNAFCIAYQNGKVCFVNVTFDDAGNAKCDEIGHRSQIPDIQNYQISKFDKGLIAYDGRTLYSVTQYGKNVENNVFMESLKFTQNIFLKTPSIIGYCHDYSRMKQTTTSMCFVSHQVLCMAMSQRINIFVLGCSDCKIRIRNLATGKKIATVLTDYDFPQSILITEKWGFIVVKTSKKLLIFSSNGTLLKEQDEFPEIKQWFTFESQDGFDFIGFEEGIIDGNEETTHGYYYFEVMNPHERTKICEIQEKIMNVHFVSKWNCFLIATDNQEILILPRT